MADYPRRSGPAWPSLASLPLFGSLAYIKKQEWQAEPCSLRVCRWPLALVLAAGAGRWRLVIGGAARGTQYAARRLRAQGRVAGAPRPAPRCPTFCIPSEHATGLSGVVCLPTRRGRLPAHACASSSLRRTCSDHGRACCAASAAIAAITRPGLAPAPPRPHNVSPGGRLGPPGDARRRVETRLETPGVPGSDPRSSPVPGRRRNPRAQQRAPTADG